MATHKSISPADEQANLEEQIRRLALGLVTAEEESQILAKLERYPQWDAIADAIPADPFLSKLRSAAHDTVGMDEDRTGVTSSAAMNEDARPSIAAEQASGTPDQGSEPSVANELQLHPELLTLTQYRFIKQLGAGGMSIVYLAENLAMGGRKEALKILNESTLRHAEAKQRFEQEIAVAAQLHHPQIVTAYSTIKLSSLSIFVMEYVEGVDLDRLVRMKGPLKVHVASAMVRQVAMGLQYAMDCQTVHRDIKPANLMLARVGGRDVIKILDFGLAKATRETKEGGGLTSAGTGMGTPHYMAPEQLLSAGTVDIRADIYSLGCTLYFLLLGKPPFSGTNYEVYHAHQTQEAQRLNLVRPDVPVELAMIVAKMMAKDPAKRFTSPQEVANALIPFVKSTNAPDTRRQSKTAMATVPPVSMVGVESELVARVESSERQPNEPQLGVAKLGNSIEVPRPSSQPVEQSAQVSPQNQPKQVLQTLVARFKRWGWKAYVCCALLATTLFAGVLQIRTQNGTIVFENLPQDAKVIVDGEQVKVQWNDDKETATIELPAGQRELQVWRNDVMVEGTTVKIASGQTTQLIVSRQIMAGSRITDLMDLESVYRTSYEAGSLLELPHLGVKMRYCPVALVEQGTEDDQGDRSLKVVNPQAFWIAETEVTRAQWKAVMGTSPWQGQGFDQLPDNTPVTNICHGGGDQQIVPNSATEFCIKLTERERKAGRIPSSFEYALPTEAQWELACSAGDTDDYTFGEDTNLLSDFAWWGGGNSMDGNCAKEPFPHPVATKQANDWGLYDMHGNVAEYCSDWFGDQRRSGIDVGGPKKGTIRVGRGGSWRDGASLCRAFERQSVVPSEVDKQGQYGFRIVLQPAVDWLWNSTEPQRQLVKDLPDIDKDLLPATGRWKGTQKLVLDQKPVGAGRATSAEVLQITDKDFTIYISAHAPTEQGNYGWVFRIARYQRADRGYRLVEAIRVESSVQASLKLGRFDVLNASVDLQKESLKIDYTRSAPELMGSGEPFLAPPQQDQPPRVLFEFDAEPDPQQKRLKEIRELRETLIGHRWHYHDNLYPPGGPCSFRPNGSWHDWNWKYWVTGPREVRVHYDRNNNDPDTGIAFTFNDDLTEFHGRFTDPQKRVHIITGRRQ